MNPDNPKKCKELMTDGIHCWMKTVEIAYEDGYDGEKVKCPFILVEVEQI